MAMASTPEMRISDPCVEICKVWQSLVQLSSAQQCGLLNQSHTRSVSC
jgi:hypothetical protein